MSEALQTAVKAIQSQTDFTPDIAIVLGSGLGAFADTMDTDCKIPYAAIPNFPVSTVDGHKGQLCFGFLGGKRIAVMQGRVHFYEGYRMDEVVFPIRLLRLLGAQTLILTNAAGGVNTTFKPGDLMLLTDHISCFVPSPLIGKNESALGVRFPDMREVYDRKIREKAKTIADALSVPLQEGVYLQFSGPAYETPAEIRLARTLGADAVGMSTACEAIAAKHCGMRVCGISCITNMACGITNSALSHEEVKITAAKSSKAFTALLSHLVAELE